MSDLKKWKKKAWQAFSAYIRRREADDNGMVRCCTCGTVKNWREVDAGHFVPGRNNSVLYDTRIVWAQCKSCNRNQGEQYKYSLFLKGKGFSDQELEELLNLKHKIKPMTAMDHFSVFQKYKEWLS